MLSHVTSKAGVAWRLVVVSCVAGIGLGCGRTSQAPGQGSATVSGGDGNLQNVSPQRSESSVGQASGADPVVGAAASTPFGTSRNDVKLAEATSSEDRPSERTPGGPLLIAPKPPGEEPALAQEPDNVARRPLFQDWPQPDAMIVFSGQQHGYLEPCGCAPDLQIGGLARRHGFIESLRKKNWPLLLLDLGGLLEDTTEPFGPDKFIIGPEQSEAKFQISLSALDQMGYDDMGLGPEDLSVPKGLPGVAGWLLNIERPRVLNANLDIENGFVDLGLFVPYVVREVGPVKIAVTAMVSDKHKALLLGPGIEGMQSPEEALPGVLERMKKESDLQVLLFYGHLDEAKQLAQKFPDLDVIIHTHEFDEPPGRVEKVDENAKTVLVTVGTKGKHVGALGIFRNADQPIRFELVPLDKRFPEAKQIRRLLDEDFLKILEELQLVEKTPKRPDPARPGQSFVGSEKCSQCHPNVYANWKKTDHAHALQTLVLGHARNKPKHQAGGKQVNPECVVCHTTGFNFVSGYDGTEETKHLGGNGCENCHGAGSEHVKIYSNLNSTPQDKTRARKFLHLDPQLPERNICSRCHDGDNDPTFVFDKRWSEGDPPVEHGDAAEQDRKLWPSIREKLAK